MRFRVLAAACAAFVVLSVSGCGAGSAAKLSAVPEGFWEEGSGGTPMIRMKGLMLYGAGEVEAPSDEGIDGVILSSVGWPEEPQEDGQSNFGVGFGYQYAGDRLLVSIDGKWVKFAPEGAEIASTHEAGTVREDGMSVVKTHFEMSNGLWRTVDYAYEQKVEASGLVDSIGSEVTYEFLSNIGEISFERALKATDPSGRAEDYFKKEEAVLVGMRVKE